MPLEVEEAIFLLLNGETSRMIGERLGVTPQTVRNRRDDFVKEAEKIGLMQAADNLGVKEQVEGLIKLASNIKKYDIGLENCISGSEISITAKKLNLSDKQLENFMQGIYQYGVTNGLSPERVGDLLTRLQDLHMKTGMDYSDLLEEWESKHTEKQRLEKTITDYKQSILVLENELKNKLDESEATQATLEAYRFTETKLKEYDLDLDDPSKCLRVLEEIKNQGYDPHAIITQLEMHGSLLDRNRELTESRKRLERENNELEKEVHEKQSMKEKLEVDSLVLVERNRQLKIPLEDLGVLNGLGLENKDITDFRDIIIGSKHTVPGLKRLLIELGGIEELIGSKREAQTSIENAIINLKETKSKLESSIDYMEESRNKLLDEGKEVLRDYRNEFAVMSEDFENMIINPDTGLKPLMLKEAREGFEETKALLNEFQRTYFQQMEKIRAETEKVSEEVDKTKEDIFQIGLEAGKYKSLQNLVNLFTGWEMSYEERRLALASILDRASVELKRINYPEEGRSVEIIRDRILSK